MPKRAQRGPRAGMTLASLEDTCVGTGAAPRCKRAEHRPKMRPATLARHESLGDGLAVTGTREWGWPVRNLQVRLRSKMVGEVEVAELRRVNGLV
jgi:hypothetical protein